MKKYAIILFLTIAFTTTTAYSEELQNSVLANPSDVIFRSSLTDLVENLEETHEEYNDNRDFQSIDPYNMPLFKQVRLRITNKFYERAEKNAQKKANKPQNNKFNFLKKFKNEENLEEENFSETESELKNSIETTTSILPKDNNLSLESGINTEVTGKQMTLDAENINFDDETGEMVATGNPKLYFPPQDTTIIADKMTYNDGGNILKAYGNVTIIKGNTPLKSDYMEVDMNEETMVMDNLFIEKNTVKMKSKKAEQQEGLIILKDGSMYSDKSSISRISSTMVGPRFEEMIIDPNEQVLFFGNPEGSKLTIKANSIEVDGRKNHDIIRFKNTKFYHDNKYLFRLPSMKIYTNKERTYFEGNYPEFGSRRKIGMYAGPGITFGGPNGSVIKVVPFINYKNKFGFGGLLKYVNTNNRTELGYGSASEIFFLKGKQKLDDKLFLHYAANSYTDEWFLGGRMAKYMAEIYYDDSKINKNFLGKNMDLIFRHRVGFGLMQDDDKGYYGETFSNASEMSTTRTRYMAELNQILYKYENIEKRTSLNAGLVMQGSAALYGTGDTQFIARMGPGVKLQYKNWMQNIGYFITGSDDHSPMPRYDAYRYGCQSIYISEAFRLTKYVSVGWSGYISLSKDTPNGKMFQENAFIVSLGPDDLKILLGYDFVRQRTYFAFNVAFDPKGTVVNYDKMVIKNPEKLGQHEDSDNNENQIAFVPSPTEQSDTQNEYKVFNKKPVKTSVLEYAQVIELEDPDREKID